MPSEQLKSCPFCGEAKIYVCSRAIENGKRVMQGYCSSCGATGPESRLCPEKDGVKFLMTAAKIGWNTRNGGEGER